MVVSVISLITRYLSKIMVNYRNTITIFFIFFIVSIKKINHVNLIFLVVLIKNLFFTVDTFIT